MILLTKPTPHGNTGIMESWNDGLKCLEEPKTFGFCSFRPRFHYSNIPIFQMAFIIGEVTDR